MSVAIYYLQILPAIREAARRHGYAIGLHGSMIRDFDLIACPWQEEASPPDVLVMAVAGAIAGSTVNIYEINEKPHGRKAWKIKMGGGAYIDLSVMPCKQ